MHSCVPIAECAQPENHSFPLVPFYFFVPLSSPFFFSQKERSKLNPVVLLATDLVGGKRINPPTVTRFHVALSSLFSLKPHCSCMSVESFQILVPVTFFSPWGNWEHMAWFSCDFVLMVSTFFYILEISFSAAGLQPSGQQQQAHEKFYSTLASRLSGCVSGTGRRKKKKKKSACKCPAAILKVVSVHFFSLFFGRFVQVIFLSRNIPACSPDAGHAV